MTSNPICPVTEDGRHKRKPWAYQGRSGFACERCHKTWTWHGDHLLPTYVKVTMI